MSVTRWPCSTVAAPSPRPSNNCRTWSKAIAIYEQCCGVWPENRYFKDQLEAVRVTFLGRSDGRISGILRGLGQLPPEDRPKVGQKANQVKTVVSDALEARASALAGPAASGGIDLTLPGRRRWKGG